MEFEVSGVGKIRGKRNAEVPSVIDFYGVPFGRVPLRFTAPVMDFYPKNMTLDEGDQSYINLLKN